jgi:quinohemoprotein ethanol dehydrogenase
MNLLVLVKPRPIAHSPGVGHIDQFADQLGARGVMVLKRIIRYATSFAVLELATFALACAVSAQNANSLSAPSAKADRDASSRLAGGNDAHQGYFSPLKSIDKKSVGRLGFAWASDLGTVRGQEATPLVVDGVIYTSGSIGIVYALDAATGQEKWRFTPQVNPMSMRNPCCDTDNKGVAVGQGRVYVASVDGQLHALDAATGHELWSIDTIIDHKLSYSSSGAPVIAHDVVVIGNSGGDMDRGGVRGYVSAFDLKNGSLKWRFFTVPPAPGRRFEHPEMALAARTWDPARSADDAGGATVWDGMTYDPDVNLLYFGTGNAAPNNGGRVGADHDLLFACSILAVNPDTGRMAWHYQTTPGDHWDFDATQKLVLADLTIDGRQRRVVMQANKNGFFYVLDRVSGQLISAEKFAYVNWASSVDRSTGRPILTERANYVGKQSILYPASVGAHTWPPMSFDPMSRLVYIPVIDAPGAWIDLEANHEHIKFINGAFTTLELLPDDNYDAAALRPLFGPVPELNAIQGERKGRPLVRELIRAWNPVTNKTVWEHETSSGVRGYDGGVLSTAGGLVFQGRGSGDLFVYAADTGAILKVLQTGSHIMAAPMSYEVDGTQYVAVQTGYGGGAMAIGTIPPSSAAFKYDNENRILAFRLDGGSVPLPRLRSPEPFPEPPAERQKAAQIAHG